MKTRLTALVALLLLGVSAYAQEEDPPFFKQFSVEIATGLPPIHTLLEVNGTKYDKSFAREGKEPDMNGAWMPALSVSAVWKTAPRWEMVLTGGVSWCHHKVIQYGTFGIDPQGNPRYNLKDPHPDGWRDSAPIGALFFQARCFWNPTQKVKLYSAHAESQALLRLRRRTRDERQGALRFGQSHQHRPVHHPHRRPLRHWPPQILYRKHLQPGRDRL